MAIGDVIFLFFFWEVSSIKIVKVFNNNVSLVVNDKGFEEVVMGNGIGFGLKPGDSVNQAKIEKRFVFDDQKQFSDLENLFERIDSSDLEMASEVIQLFEDRLGRKSAPTLLLTLADHIGFALIRAKEGMSLRSPLEWELRQVYPNEYQVALDAVKYLNKLFDVCLPIEEAAFLTLHFVNYIDDNKNLNETILVSKIIQNILTIINYHYGKEFKQDSIYFSRFVTHIRYFVKRQLSIEKETTEPSSLLDVIQIKHPKDYACAMKIKQFLEETYHWKISEDEVLYLALHLNRLAS